MKSKPPVTNRMLSIKEGAAKAGVSESDILANCCVVDTAEGTRVPLEELKRLEETTAE